MSALADRLRQERPTVWLDGHEYAAKLLAGGTASWLDVAACVAWQRKTQGLLKSDVVSLPLASVTEAWLAAHAELRKAMSAKSRATFPLKTLLADETLRAHLLELTRALRAGLAGLPLVLALPTPRAWVVVAYRQAHSQATEAGEDEADSAAVYVADFLRAFGEAGVDGLLLEEADDYAPASAAELACYQAVLNVAAHYRWDAGLHLADAGKFSGDLPGYAFSIAAQALNGAGAGVAAPAAFWNGAAGPAASLRYARIPPDSKPEAVLERIAALR